VKSSEEQEDHNGGRERQIREPNGREQKEKRVALRISPPSRARQHQRFPFFASDFLLLPSPPHSSRMRRNMAVAQMTSMEISPQASVNGKGEGEERERERTFELLRRERVHLLNARQGKRGKWVGRLELSDDWGCDESESVTSGSEPQASEDTNLSGDVEPDSTFQ
jgi:hypothetical protein